MAGSAFFARRGERQDGHQYVEEAFRRGAGVCVVEQSWDSSRLDQTAAGSLIKVADCTEALGRLASYVRRKSDVPVIAITGSCGKTTTKEICRSLLSSVLGPGTASIKSYNNHVGLPLTLLNASDDSRWFVLEAGMNHSGELDYLGAIAQPDVAAVLNIGPVHLGHFHSLSEIADAKCELLKHLSGQKKAVVLQGDRELEQGLRRSKQAGSEFEQVSFALDQDADYVAREIEREGERSTRFKLLNRGEEVSVLLPYLGETQCGECPRGCSACGSKFP